MSTDVESGNCTCKTGYIGEKCHQCDIGHYDFNNGTDASLICLGKIILDKENELINMIFS